jgi:hypothetical protein
MLGWTDNNNVEIDEKCVAQFGPRDALGGDTVLNGHEYLISEPPRRPAGAPQHQRLR